MVEIRSIAGTKFIHPEQETKMPFKLVERQFISRQQYHEIPSEEFKQNVVFGKNILDRYDRLRKLKKARLPESFIKTEQKLLDKAISASKEDLSKIIKYSRKSLNKDYRAGVNNFFTHAFKDEGIRKRYIDLYRKYLKGLQLSKRPKKLPIGIQSPTDMIDAFIIFKKTIPNDLYLDMIINNNKRFDETTQELRTQLLQFYDSPFVSAVRDFAIHHGIDVTDMNERMEELKKILAIYFDDSRAFTESKSAGFTYGTGQVTLSTFLDIEEVMKPTFAHEIIHNLAGHSYRVQIDEMATDFDAEDHSHAFYAVVPEKHGIGFYNNLRWLNEGLSDLISQEICPSKDPNIIYGDEKSLLKRVMETGKNQISIDLAYQSYFEEHNQKLPEDKQFPKTKIFLQTVSNSWSSGFLIRLDKLIRSYGRRSHSVIKEINEHFSEIAPILMRHESVDKVIPEARKILADGMKTQAAQRRLMDAIRGIK